MNDSSNNDKSLILDGNDPESLAASATRIQSPDNLGPVTMNAASTNILQDTADQDVTSTLGFGFGKVTAASPGRQQIKTKQINIPEGTNSNCSQEKRMRAQLTEALAHEKMNSRGGVGPLAQDSNGKRQGSIGTTVKPIMVQIFQVPDTLKASTRVERNVKRNAQKSQNRSRVRNKADFGQVRASGPSVSTVHPGSQEYNPEVSFTLNSTVHDMQDTARRAEESLIKGAFPGAKGGGSPRFMEVPQDTNRTNLIPQTNSHYTTAEKVQLSPRAQVFGNTNTFSNKDDTPVTPVLPDTRAISGIASTKKGIGQKAGGPTRVEAHAHQSMPQSTTNSQLQEVLQRDPTDETQLNRNQDLAPNTAASELKGVVALSTHVSQVQSINAKDYKGSSTFIANNILTPQAAQQNQGMNQDFQQKILINQQNIQNYSRNPSPSPRVKTINNQDHSRYTSYPAPAPLKVFNNLNSTFNTSINGIRHKFESKKASLRGDFDKSLYSRYSQGDSTYQNTVTNYKGSLGNFPQVGQTQPPLSDITMGAQTPANVPGLDGMSVHYINRRGSSPDKVHAMQNENNQNYRPTITQGQQSIPSNNQSLATKIQKSEAFGPGKSLVSEIQGQNQLNAQPGNIRTIQTTDNRQTRKNFQIAAQNSTGYAKAFKQATQYPQISSRTNEYSEVSPLKSGSQTAKFLGSQRFRGPQNLATMSRPQQRFSYLQTQESSKEDELNSILQARNSQNFVPYTQERNAFGRLLGGQGSASLEQEQDIVQSGADKQQSEQTRSRFQTLRPLNREDTKGYSNDGLSSLDLHEQIQRIAKLKRNDPLKMTTERNLRKIKENARLKIRNQVKYSKRNPIAFTSSESQRPQPHLYSQSLEYDLQSQTNYNETSIHKQSVDQQNNSLPQGIEQICIPHTQQTAKHQISTMHTQPESIYGQPSPRDDGSLATDGMTRRSSAVVQQTKTGINFEQFERSKLGPGSQSIPKQPLGIINRLQTQPAPAIETKATLEQKLAMSHNYFEVNLPNSRSYLTNLAVLSNAIVHKPFTVTRADTKSYVKPRIFDVVRGQTKNKMAQHLKYCSPAADQVHTAEQTIPVTLLEEHRQEYTDFPQMSERGPITHVPTTFGTSQRFIQPQPAYTEEAHWLSGLDYHESVYGHQNQAPFFEKYAKRKDNFLTKSQEQLIQLKRDEAAERIHSLQKQREAQEAEQKDREKQTQGPGGAPGKPQEQIITFTSADHNRVLEMRPHVKNMVSQIRDHARKLRDSNGGNDDIFDS